MNIEQKNHDEWIDSLKEGDPVAVKVSTKLGNGPYIPGYIYGKIEKITPKRTKFYVDGREITELNMIVPITKETDSERDQYNSKLRVFKLINSIQQICSSGAAKNISKDKLDAVFPLLKKVLEALELGA